MTREDALEEVNNDMDATEATMLIDRIYNDFEKEVKQIKQQVHLVGFRDGALSILVDKKEEE